MRRVASEGQRLVVILVSGYLKRIVPQQIVVKWQNNKTVSKNKQKNVRVSDMRIV